VPQRAGAVGPAFGAQLFERIEELLAADNDA
jgi:hypothetical protein